MSSIRQRLVSAAETARHSQFGAPASICTEAAEEIARLHAALQPFAKIAEDYETAHDARARRYQDEGRTIQPHPDSHRTSVYLGDCRKARAAISSGDHQ